jgi:hypothetical protein
MLDLRAPATDCGPLSSAPRGYPNPGTVFRYRQEDGTVTSREVVEVAGDMLTLRLRAERSAKGRVMSETAPTFLRTQHGGVFASGSDGQGASFTYGRDPTQVIRALGPGQTAEIETTQFDKSGAVRGEGVTRVEYVACGNLDTPASSGLVRVYRLTLPTTPRTTDRSADLIVYLSEELGFPVAFQSPKASVAIEIEPPPR